MMKHGRYYLRLVSRLCIAFAMIFSIMLCTCVNDVHAEGLFYEGNSGEVYFYDLVTYTAGTSDFTITDYEYNGAYMDSYSSFIENDDGRTYEVTIDRTYTFQMPIYLYYKNVYTLSVGFSNLRAYYTTDGYVTHLNTQTSVIVGGNEYFGDQNAIVTTLTNTSDNHFAVRVRTRFLVNAVGGGLRSFGLGSVCDNMYACVNDLGLYQDSSDVVSSVNQGNNLQQQGNQLQQESNNLQQQENQLQQEQNETTNNIFGSISDFFGSFFDNLIGIFVPEDGYFEDFFARLNQFFSEKLGMLYSPIELFINLLTGIQNASAVDAGIPFPGLKWENTYIIEPQTISLSDIAKDFPGLQEKIYFVTDVIMVGAVVMLLQNKLKEILTT